MEYRYVKTVDEVVQLDIRDCYSRHATFDEKGAVNPKLTQSFDIVLVGKHAIAEFMGITERTLRRWIVEYPKPKHPMSREIILGKWFGNTTKLPINLEGTVYYAYAKTLIELEILKQLYEFESKLVRKTYSEMCKVGFTQVMENRLDIGKYHKKTIDKVAMLLNLLLYIMKI